MKRDPGNLRIAYFTEPFNGASLDPEVLGIVNETAEILASTGHTVEELTNTFDPDVCKDSHGTLAISHIGAMLQKLEAQTGKPITERDVERVTWNNFQSSKFISGADYASALNQIHQHGRMVDEIFNDYDLILTPTMACMTPLIGALNTMSDDTDSYLTLLYQMIGFTALINDTGHPAASLPLGACTDGMPVGSQLVAPFGREDLLYQLGFILEQENRFTEKPIL